MRLSGRNGVDALAASYLETLTRNWDSIPEATMGPVADTLARLIGIACGAAAAEQPDAVRAGRLAEAKRHIDRHLADPDLSPAGVAAAIWAFRSARCTCCSSRPAPASPATCCAAGWRSAGRRCWPTRRAR